MPESKNKLDKSSLCNQIQTKYEALKTLEQEFAAVYEKFCKGDMVASEYAKAKVLKARLEKVRDALKEKINILPWFPRELKSVVKKEEYKDEEKIEGWKKVNRSYIHVFSDGRIVSGSFDGTIRIWIRDENGKWNDEEIIKLASPVSIVQTLPDGRIVSGSEDGVIRILKKEDITWKCEELKGHTKKIKTIQVLPDGRIVSGGADGTINVWTKDTSSNTWISEKLVGYTSFSITALQVLPDGRIVSGSEDGVIRILKKEDITWKCEELKGHTKNITALQVLPDGRIVSGGADDTINVWTKDTSSNTWISEKLVGYTPSSMFSITALQVLPDGRIVSGNGKGIIRIWMKDTNSNIWKSKELKWHRGIIISLQVLSDGRIMSSSSSMEKGIGVIHIWDGEKV